LKVLVTGGAGYLGSAICRLAVERSDEVLSTRFHTTPATWSTKTQKRSLPVSSTASTSTPGSDCSTVRETSWTSCCSFVCCAVVTLQSPREKHP